MNRLMKAPQHLKTIRLRPFMRDEVKLYFDWNQDAGVLGQFVEPDHRSLAELLADFDLDGWRTNRMRCWLVVSDDNTIMGYGHCWEFDPFETHVEFGRILLPAFRGLGLGPSMLELIIDLVFEETNAHRAQSVTSCGNIAVQRNWQRLGMSPEARLRDYMKLNDKYVDVFLFSVLRPEWQERKNRLRSPILVDANCSEVIGTH